MFLKVMVKERKRSEHYVSNKDFHQALVDYKKLVDEAKDKNLPKPKIPNYIGECFLKIATHLSYKPNFVNYMFKDDMICDGIENCVLYIHNFDVTKKNPFAYFTQVIYYAFLRRIAKEKKQLEIKTKIIEKSGFEEVFSADSSDVGYDHGNMNSIKDGINYRFT
jgi:hypothetical protein